MASLEKIREGLRLAVKELNKEELATKILPDIQPIRTIIIHIVGAEYFWVQEIIAGNPMTAEIKELLHPDFWFKDFAAEDLEIDYCLSVVKKIHRRTRETLAILTIANWKKLLSTVVMTVNPNIRCVGSSFIFWSTMPSTKDKS